MRESCADGICVMVDLDSFAGAVGPRGRLPVRAGDGSSAWDKVSALLGNKPEDDNFKLIHVADLAALKADPNSHVVILRRQRRAYA